jgi:hypothetical protein
MRRGDVVWYRAWVWPGESLDRVRANLRLPGAEVARRGSRSVWVSGVPITPEDGQTLDAAAAEALSDGISTIVVKAMQGPFPAVTGDALVERPTFCGAWSPERASLCFGPLALTEPATATSLRVALVSPEGRELRSAVFPVETLTDGSRVVSADVSWPLTEYGENRLIVDDGAGHRQSFPVHLLGLHLFHWGWYSAGGGTSSNGFTPGSNAYIDQLFSRLGDWGRPHHSISWGGAILEPGTGFHQTTGTDYVAGFRDQIASGKLGFVGMPFPPRNICTDFGESLLRSMRLSRELYRTQLGVEPRHFYSHDATMTPLLPRLEGSRSLLAPDGTRLALQRDPDDPKSMLASVPELPSCGLRTYRPSDDRATGPRVTAEPQGDGLALSNGLVTVSLAADGTAALRTAGVDSPERVVLTGANSFYVARPGAPGAAGPLSSSDRPLNLDYCTRLQPAGPARVICSGPVMAAAEFTLTCADYPALSARMRIALVAGERQARVRLTTTFTQPTVLVPAGGPGPHEGTYIPGIFVAFPMDAAERPLADMAYCLTDGVLTSTNHETFLRTPFRNDTFNTLSLAGPGSATYAVLTRGLPDFFVVRKPQSFLGMSLGVAIAGCEYSGEYVHEYALLAPGGRDEEARRVEAYLAAQSFLVEPLAVSQPVGAGDAAEASLLAAAGEGVLVPGVQMEDAELRCRVVNLMERATTARLGGVLEHPGTQVLPRGDIQRDGLRLPPQAVRELVVKQR